MDKEVAVQQVAAAAKAVVVEVADTDTVAAKAEASV